MSAPSHDYAELADTLVRLLLSVWKSREQAP